MALYERKRRAALNIPRLNSTGRGWPLLGSLIVRAVLLGPEAAPQSVEFRRKAGIGRRAVGRALAAGHDEIEGAFTVGGCVRSDGLLRIGDPVENHRVRPARVAPHVELRHTRAVR